MEEDEGQKMKDEKMRTKDEGWENVDNDNDNDNDTERDNDNDNDNDNDHDNDNDFDFDSDYDDHDDDDDDDDVMSMSMPGRRVANPFRAHAANQKKTTFTNRYFQIAAPGAVQKL